VPLNSLKQTQTQHELSAIHAAKMKQ